MTQHIYGFQLKANDESTSPWVFTNTKSQFFTISVQLKNGAKLTFAGQPFEIEAWAYPREVIVNHSVFEFNADEMKFVEVVDG